MTPTSLIIAQLIVLYGIPGAIQIVQLLQKPEVTVEGMEALRGLVRLPSEYLKETIV